MSDWEYSGDNCPKCNSQLATRRCDALGCEDGYVEHDDPMYPSEYDRCDTCNGSGYEKWCRECGWDCVYNQFLNPRCEAQWLARQEKEESSQ
jgi:RecJ-like exonuclease